MSDQVPAELAKERRFHLVIGTHWDREWRESFEQLRFDMVRLIDHVIDGLESGRLRTPFVTDGTTSVIDDYLEIRPEMRARVETLLASGSLVTGPWYVMPDEFLVSGESLIRNLSLGRTQAKELGVEGSRAGLVCDMFGHNSQLPQILAGFGITGALIWRGVNTEWRSLLWRGADGTELPTHRFGPWGYGNYAISVRGAFNHHANVITPERIASHLEAELAATPTGPILLFDSCDHQDWDEIAYSAFLRHAESWPAEHELVHSDLDQFLADLSDDFKPSAVVEGELREPGRSSGPSEMGMKDEDRGSEGERQAGDDKQSVIPGVASSRVYLKQANVRCEGELLRWAEPLAAVGTTIAGVEQAPGFAQRAWRLLLQNHAHDSIGGCSVDGVHRDMEHRFDQAEAIAEKIADDAFSTICASIEGAAAPNEIRVVVFNPSPRDRRLVHEIDLEIPAGNTSFEEFFGYERKPAFRIYEGDSGKELPYQRIGQELGQRRFRVRPTQLVEVVPQDIVRVAVDLELPALGYRTLVVRAADPSDPVTRHPAVPGIATGPRSMANEHLAVAIENDGTLTLTDRASGSTYTGLLAFQDDADLGDGWYHGPAANDEVLSSTGPAEVALLADGPLLARFRVTVTMQVPTSFDRSTCRRSEVRVPMRLETTITLHRHARELRIRTEVTNPAKDHRLRVLFPSGASAQTYYSDTPFDVVEREVGVRSDSHLYRELETETRPHSSWTAVGANGVGLAVVGAGLHEAAVRDLPDRPIALTLYRCTELTAVVHREPEGQMLGRHLTFDYALVPFAEIDRVALCELGQELAADLRTVQQSAPDIEIRRTQPSLPASASFARLEGEVVLTSFRRVDNALEIRAFNPNPEQVEAVFSLGLPVTPGDASFVRVDGQTLASLSPEADGSYRTTFGPKQIHTLRIPVATATRAPGETR